MKALLLIAALSGHSWAGRAVSEAPRASSPRLSAAAHRDNRAALAALPPSSLSAVAVAALQAPVDGLTGLSAADIAARYEAAAAADAAAPAGAAESEPLSEAFSVDDRLSARHTLSKPDLAMLESWFGKREPGLVSAAVGGVDVGLLGELLETAGTPRDARDMIGHVVLNPRPSPAVARELETKHFGVLAKIVQLRRDQFEGQLTENFRSLAELVTVYRERGVAGAALRAVLDHAGPVGSGFAVSLTEAVWSAIPAGARAQLLQRLVVYDEQAGHELTLRVKKGDDLGALAREFAAGRDPRAVERLLRSKLGSREEIEVALTSLLPRFIRRKAGTFEACTGPNCVASSLSVRAPYELTGKYDGAEGLGARLKEGYHRVDSGEPKAGDVLIYTTPEKEFRHAVVYAGRGFVFSKAGMQRYYPYVIQTQTHVESYFFPDGEFRRLVFRPKS